VLILYVHVVAPNCGAGHRKSRLARPATHR
jgi:hypothetical protein